MISQQAGHTIAGVGNIDATFKNNGTVRAEASLGIGSTLRLLTNSKPNHELFTAIHGGEFIVESGILSNWGTVTQTLTGGTYEVVGNSTMRLVGVNNNTLSAQIQLDGANSKLFSTSAGTTSARGRLHTIESARSLTLLNGRHLVIGGVLSNQGTIGLDGPFTQLTVAENFQQLGGLTQLKNGATLHLLGVSNLLSGGTLGGNGTITGELTLGAGSLLSPGLSPVRLTFNGDLTWDRGAMIAFDLRLGALDSDLITVSGQLLKSGADPWLFEFTDNGWQVGRKYDLFSFGNTNFLASDFAFANGEGFDGTFAFRGNNLQFTLAAIPEPSAAVLILAPVFGCITASSRRRRV